MNQVAQTIKEQIGGKALFMIGATNIVGHENTLTFRVGKNAKGVNCVMITLDEGLDLYKMSFLYIRGGKFTVKAQIEGVYAEDLNRMIEMYTGMYTSL